jgi:7-keto-8-aminopelargonate synthetase-like enzyme
VLAPREVIARIVERSRLFTGSTPLPLPLAAAALASLEILRSDTSLRRRLEHAAFGVKKLLRTALPDLPDNPSPILAVTPANERHASRLKRVLLRAAIFPSFIQYPGGPESGYFRFALSSEHTAGQLAALARVLHYHGRHVEAH